MCSSHVTCGSHVPSFDIDGDNDLLLAATLTLFAVLVPELPTSSFLTSGHDLNRMQIINLSNTLLILVPDPGGMTTMLIEICTSSAPFPYEVLGRGKRPKNTERMNALIQAEGEDIDNPSRHPRRSRRAPKKQNAAVDPNNFFLSLPVEEASDADDGDFTGSESSSQSSSSG
ncbi:hypothetical protein BDR03DRAFT_987924, partial [Suillus americanus]